jgi:shikimate kinase/3-dehydroquinate synthase
MSHIFLYGPPGTGKSTVGKILAQNLFLPFVDLDQVIEAKANLPIGKIMKQQGESAFRSLETSTLIDLEDEVESVVALSAGALLREENRIFAENNGKVILLTAEFDTLVERLQNDSVKRPLLKGNLQEKLTSLLEKWNEHYNSFPVIVHAENASADQNAQQVQIVLGRHHLSAMGDYDVIVQSVEQIGNLFHERGLQNPIIVTDENVLKFHAEKVAVALRKSGFNPNVLTVPAGETHKKLETISDLWKSFLENELDRKSTVIALGGGVIGDLSGFAASTYMRGINWVTVPTTLLSMVDASIGGKTGIDLPEGKNLIGSFYPPKLALADPQLLHTLPEAELISGIAEVVKHGIISDPELFSLCTRGLDWVKKNLEEIVKRAMAVKIKIIEEDPYEKGLRAVLNYGHTVGHAVELVSKFSIRHGEAIAIGMVAEAKYAVRIGVAAKSVEEAIVESLKALGLPIDIPKEMRREEIIRAMRADKKKNVNTVRFALPVEIGKIKLMDVMNLESVIE